MKKLMIVGALAALAGLGAIAAFAPSQSAALAEGEQVRARTATFAVDNMTCATCPITVRTAMSRVDGVRSVEVDFDARRATVSYDPARTTPEAIAAASADAGYPAQVLPSQAS